MLDLAVVVTVYNLEKYINDCLESLSNQTLKNMEVIIVDDGSTDLSGEICDQFAKKDPRIKVFHKKNKGRIAARFFGVEHSGAKYIAFVDGDDWVAPDMFEQLLINAMETNADLVVSGYKEVRENICIEKHAAILPGVYKNQEELEYVKKNWFCYDGKDELGVFASIWAKVYRREQISEAFKLIPDQLYRGEDLLLNGIYLSKCGIISIVNQALYFYRQSSDSTINRKCPELFSQIGCIQDILFDIYKDEREILETINARNFLNFVRLWNFENVSGVYHIPYYTYDYSWIEGKTIALYGAGKVGQDYYWFLSRVNPGALKIWVDRNYFVARNKGYDVMSVDCLDFFGYDAILIAIESEQIANEIKAELITKHRIKNIIWHEPKHCWI